MELENVSFTEHRSPFPHGRLRSQIGNFRARAEQLEVEIAHLQAANDRLRATQDSAADVAAELQVRARLASYNPCTAPI